jgi:hypothetical protein
MTTDQPSRTRAEELTAYGRAAAVTYLLAQGQELTNAQIQTHSGIKTLPGVYYLMDRLSGAIPLYQPRPGVWRLLDRE